MWQDTLLDLHSGTKPRSTPPTASLVSKRESFLQVGYLNTHPIYGLMQATSPFPFQNLPFFLHPWHYSETQLATLLGKPKAG